MFCITCVIFFVLALMSLIALFKNKVKAKKYGLWALFVFILALFFVAIAPGSDDNKPAKTNVVQKTSETKQTDAAESPVVPETTINVYATKLFRDYHANEVAADAKYKDKKLQVIATIASIDKDMTDSIVLRLNSGNEFEDVDANLADGQDAKAASLSKNSEILLICTGGGMILESPILNDCIIDKVRNPHDAGMGDN